MNIENALALAPYVDPEAMLKSIENYKTHEGEEGYDPALIARMEALYVRVLRSASWVQPFGLGLHDRPLPQTNSCIVTVDTGKTTYKILFEALDGRVKYDTICELADPIGQLILRVAAEIEAARANLPIVITITAHPHETDES